MTTIRKGEVAHLNAYFFGQASDMIIWLDELLRGAYPDILCSIGIL